MLSCSKQHSTISVREAQLVRAQSKMDPPICSSWRRAASHASSFCSVSSLCWMTVQTINTCQQQRNNTSCTHKQATRSYLWDEVNVKAHQKLCYVLVETNNVS
eukprot:m.254590 g.254590  ORF g.254590 m.254590 type:complete len:103 (+) comp15494_c1_seq24:278-586(+)